MSGRALTWAVQVKVGSPAGKAVLMMLANHADDAGTCFPGQALLAGETELGERTVRRWLDKLEARGLLVRERRMGRHGFRTSDRYRLPIGRDLNSFQSVSVAANPDTYRPLSPHLPATQSKRTGHSDRVIIREPSEEPSDRREKNFAGKGGPEKILHAVLDPQTAKRFAQHCAEKGGRLTQAEADSLVATLKTASARGLNPVKAIDHAIASRWKTIRLDFLENAGLLRAPPPPPIDWPSRAGFWKRERTWPVGWGVAPGYPGFKGPKELFEKDAPAGAAES